MKRTDGEVKLNISEIIFAPILALWNMANNGVDVTDKRELNPDSSNKTEAYLAKDLEKLKNEYENTKNIKKIEKIQGIEVDNKTLGSIAKIQQIPREPKNKEEKDKVRD